MPYNVSTSLCNLILKHYHIINDIAIFLEINVSCVPANLVFEMQFKRTILCIIIEAMK